MHRFLVASAFFCILGSTAGPVAASDSAFPYDVQTVAADVPLRCGPGRDFYVTELLGRRRSLTVYRQAAGGWLAVRPTDTSYSLLAARQTRETPLGDVVEIADTHAVSWVGTSEDQPDELKWQVRLKPGEKVVVVGEETRRVYPGGPRELHFRIAPPAGEFRWVHEQDVRHASGVRGDEPVRHGNVQLTDFRVVVEETDAEAPRDAFVARKPRSSITGSDVARDDPKDDRDDPPRPARRASRSRSELPPLTGTEFEKQLRDLDVQLSLMVSAPVETWQLAELRDDVDDLIARGGTTVDRGRAQLLSEKLDEFEQLQARFKVAGATALSSQRSSPENVQPATPPQPSALNPRFDGSGWLYPVHSRNQAAPPYALLDADGMILQFVSPAPGLNLHRYLRKEIGVFGQQSATSTLDKPHVTAQRVVSLKRHRR